MQKFFPLLSLVAVLATAVAPRAAAATTYSYKVIAPPGAIDTQALGVNDLGEVVGEFSNSNPGAQGFLYDDGTYATVAYPGATSTVPFWIDDTGQITGEYFGPNPMNKASSSIVTAYILI